MTLKQNENYYKDGYEIAIKNARSLSKIANKSAEEHIFSIACSLSILAAEEALKASFLLVKHFNKAEELDDFDKIFKDHKTKHRHLPETSDLFEIIVDLLYTEYGLFKYLFEMIDRLANKNPESDREPILKGRKMLLSFLEKIQKQNDTITRINIDDAKSWWKTADLIKIRGFYVDQVNGVWHDPQTFTEEQFNEVQKYSLPIIKNADKIKELLENNIS